MIDPIQQHSLWGQAFEIAVKKGVLTALLDSTVNKPNALNLEAWKALDNADIYSALLQELRAVDPNLKTIIKKTARHLFVMGNGLGQTAIRECLHNLRSDPEDYSIKALWCPLDIPRTQSNFDKETDLALQEFTKSFPAEMRFEHVLTKKGYPVRADFLLWLEPSYVSVYSPHLDKHPQLL